MTMGNPLEIRWEGVIHMTGTEHWTSRTRSSSSAKSSRLRMSAKVASTDCLTIDQDLMLEKGAERYRQRRKLRHHQVRKSSTWCGPPGTRGEKFDGFDRDEIQTYSAT